MVMFLSEVVFIPQLNIHEHDPLFQERVISQKAIISANFLIQIMVSNIHSF